MTTVITKPAQSNNDTGKVDEQSVEQLHDAAYTATEAWQSNEDTEKTEGLKTAAKEANEKAKGAYKTEKDAAAKAIEEGKTVVPENYEFKLPENSPLSQARVDKIAAYAKEQGLSQEQAQGELERQSEVVAEHQEAQLSDLADKSKQWAEDIKNDKELGGENFTKTAELTRRFINKFGDEGLKNELDSTGLGNYPGLVRMIHKAASAMSEDQLVMPGSQPATTAKKTPEEAFYGTGDKSDA